MNDETDPQMKQRLDDVYDFDEEADEWMVKVGSGDQERENQARLEKTRLLFSRFSMTPDFKPAIWVIGIFWEKKTHTLYVFPLPMIRFRVHVLRLRVLALRIMHNKKLLFAVASATLGAFLVIAGILMGLSLAKGASTKSEIISEPKVLAVSSFSPSPSSSLVVATKEIQDISPSSLPAPISLSAPDAGPALAAPVRSAAVAKRMEPLKSDCFFWSSDGVKLLRAECLDSPARSSATPSPSTAPNPSHREVQPLPSTSPPKRDVLNSRY